jgi:hypothetical protein
MRIDVSAVQMEIVWSKLESPLPKVHGVVFQFDLRNCVSSLCAVVWRQKLMTSDQLCGER